MYLSKVKLSWAVAKNTHEQHKALWTLFPEREKEQRNFLFRIENFTKGEGAIALLQSGQKPESLGKGAEMLAIREVDYQLESGQQLRFRLRANPIKCIKDPTKGVKVNSKGKEYTKTVKVPLIEEEQQLSWLSNKLNGAAQINACQVQQELPFNFRKIKEKRSGKIQPVLFEGFLTIQDAPAFLDALQRGIGPAKVFGCGMLSLARA